MPSLATRNAAPADLRRYLDAFPLPNGQNLANGLAEFSTSFARPSHIDAGSLKLDVRLSDAHTSFVRFSRGVSNNESRGGENANAALNYIQANDTRTNTATVGLTSVLSRALVNDVRLNYSTHEITVQSRTDDFGGAVPLAPDGLMADPSEAANADLSFAVFRGLPGGYLIQGRFGGNLQQQFNVVDTLSYVSGRHAFKVGLDYRRLTPRPDPPTERYTYDFGGIANLLARQPTRVTVDWVTPGRPLFENFSAFAQDTFTINARSTVTYGLRYDVNPAPSSVNDIQPLLAANVDDPARVTFLPNGSSLWNTSWTNIAPRIGATYRLVDNPAHETVLRAGWGLFFDLGTGPAGDAFGSGHPYRNRVQYTRPAFPLTLAQLTPAPPSSDVPAANTVYSFPSDLEVPQTQHWNLSLEHALGGAQAVSVAYVGAAGRDLLDLQSHNLARVNPVVQVVHTLANAGTSDYHALQTQYRRRLSHGLQALASYTWSHSLDTDSGEQPVPLPPSERVPANSNRGSSDFDYRHVFNGAVTYRPSFTGTGRLSRALLSDWQIDLICMLRSGRPFTPLAFQDVGYGFYYFRPNIVPNVPVYLDDPSSPTGTRLNRDAFAVPTEPTHGNLGRNTFRGPALRQIDLALSRSIGLGRGIKALLRVEAFNVFNTPHFGLPVTLLASPTFGTTFQTLATSTGPGTPISGGQSPVHAVGGPRSIQLTGRVSF